VKRFLLLALVGLLLAVLAAPLLAGPSACDVKPGACAQVQVTATVVATGIVRNSTLSNLRSNIHDRIATYLAEVHATGRPIYSLLIQSRVLGFVTMEAAFVHQLRLDGYRFPLAVLAKQVIEDRQQFRPRPLLRLVQRLQARRGR
jgi:hypothetical protein